MDKPNPKGRRSSILKLPRQKYSDEEAEESTAIESTIARNKRRVSFASSNFVKPFVSDPEQNTIWDTTYEESVDHTNSTRSSQDLASVQSVNETGSIAKYSLDEGDDVEMMDIDEDTNVTLLDTTQHVDFTNMSLDELEIVNVADKENIIPSKCHRGSIVDFAKKLDSLQGDAKTELTYKDSGSIHVPTTGQSFEIPVDPQRKSLDILHHTTSLITENIYQGPVESIKPTFVSLNASNISTGRHRSTVTRQFGNERLSASSGQIQANRSVGFVEAFGSSKVVETDQNQSASLLSSDSMSAMDLTCEDPDIELGKIIGDGSPRANFNLSSVQTNQTKKSTEQALSFVELTRQIPTEQRKSLCNNLSSSAQIMNQTRKSIDGSARRSVDKDESILKKSQTESVQPVEQGQSSIEQRKPFCSDLSSTIQRKSICNDSSSMEFTCQIPSEQRKSLNNDLSSVHFPNQTRKSAGQDLSSMEFTCQISTDARRSINKNQTVQESRTESVPPGQKDLSSMEFTCQIPTEQRKSFDSNLSSGEIIYQRKSIDKDSSSMEFTCQIPSEQIKSSDIDLSSVQISNRTRKSTAQDLSSMEFTCQIPTDIRRSINKDQSVKESRTEKPSAQKDLSSRESTCQIPTEQRKFFDNNLSSAEIIYQRKSIDKDSSSMEFTCQIPTDARRSINKDQSIQGSQGPKQPVDLDSSSMEFTCQISSEQRKSLGNNLPSPPAQIPNQTRKSTAQDLSSMEFTCQIPTDARRSINKNQSVQESRTESVPPGQKDLSSMEFTCQIPSEQRKSFGSNLSSAEIIHQRKSIGKDSSSMEFTCQIPNDARRSINKDQSIQGSQGPKQPIDLDSSSMEFTCQIPSEQRKSLGNNLPSPTAQIPNQTRKSTGQDLSSMEFTCQIPTDARRSISKNQSVQESRTESVPPEQKDLSSMEFTCQIPSEQRKSFGSNLSSAEIIHQRKSIDKDSSSMEFTCQIPSEQRKSHGNNLPSPHAQIPNQTRKSTAQDVPSMEFTCQIPTDSRRSILRDQSIEEPETEKVKPAQPDLSSRKFTCQIPTDARRSINNDQSRTESVQPAQQDLSAMEFTCQIPSEQIQSLGNNLSSVQILNQPNISTAQDLSSMEFTCQIPTDVRRSINKVQSGKEPQSESVKPAQQNLSSMEFTCQTAYHNKDDSLQESICQTATENIKPTDHDFSSMEFTCQIPIEQRKSLGKDLSTMQITNQTRKSTTQDRSSMALPGQLPTSSKKDNSFQESVCQLPTAKNIQQGGQDLSSNDFTGQILVEKRKSINKNQSTADFSGRDKSASRTLAAKYLQISSQNRKSLEKNRSVLDVTCQTSNESTKPFDLDMSSIEFNDQLLTEYNKPADQDLSSMNLISCQIPIEETKSIERNQTTVELAGQNRTENENKFVDKDLSSTDDSRRIMSESRKYLDKNRSIEQTCPISSVDTKSFDHSLSSDKQQVHQNQFLMAFTDQFPTDNRKSNDKNQSLELTGQLLPSELRQSVGITSSSMESTLRNRIEDVKMEVDSSKQSTFAVNVSSVNLASTDAPIETYRREKHDASIMAIVSENIPVIDEAYHISKENVKSFNSSTRTTEKNVTVELKNKTLNPHEKSDIENSSIYNMPSDVLEKTNVEENKSRTFIDDLGDTVPDLTNRRQHFTSLDPLERSVIAGVQFVDDETKENLFLTASSQPNKMDDCKIEEMKATNILYSQTFSGPKIAAGEKPISEPKTPTTSFHMTLTPNLTMFDPVTANFNRSNSVAQQSVGEIAFRVPLELYDADLIDDFKCSLVDENDQLNSDTSEIEHDNKLMYVNDTYVLKTKSNGANDTMNTERGNSDDTFSKSGKHFAKDKSFAKTDQTFSKINQTFAKSEQTFAKTDQTFSKINQTFAKNDQTFAKNDQTFAKNDQTFAKNDQTFAKSDRTYAKADLSYAEADLPFAKADLSFAKADLSYAKANQSFAKADQSLAKTDKTFAKDPADVELKPRQSCRERRNMKGTSSKNSEAFKRCYNLLDNFKASMNILQDGTKLDFNIVNNDDNDRMKRLLSMLENSPTRPATAHKRIEPKLHTFLSTKSTPDQSLRKILYEQRLQIKSYLENFKFKPFNLVEVKTKSSASGDDTSDGTFENVTAEMSAELMSLSLNENTKKPVYFAQEISKLEKKASGFWNLEKVDGCKYYFSTLHGCLQFNVDFDQMSGIVSNLELKRNMQDSAHPYAHYVFHLLYEKLANPSLSSAIGNKYDILSLLEYVHLISIKSLKFQQEYERMQGDGLVIQKNMTATFTIIDIKLRIWWNITVDLKQGKLVDLDAKRGADLLKSKVADIYNMVKICPKGFDFLFSLINSIKTDLKIL